MISSSRRDIVFLVLAGIFITNALVAEIIGGKLITVDLSFGILNIKPFVLSMGILPWPVVFLTTDLINEYFGRKGVRKLSLLTAVLIAYAFVVIFFAIRVPAWENSLVQTEDFKRVLGQSQLIIIGSITAFLVGQLLDVFIFWFLRERTGGKMLWLRATGSTVISQLVDSFIVLGIAFYLPDVFNFYNKPADKLMTFDQFIAIGFTGYAFKLIIAICLTPLIYGTHAVIDRYLGEKDAETLIKQTAEQSLHHKVEE